MVMYKVKEEIYMIVQDEYKRNYTVIEGFIPSNYSIWNAHVLHYNGHSYLKLYNEDKVVGYTVDDQSLLALELNDTLAEKIEGYLAGGRNPKEVKRTLKSKDGYLKKCAEKIKPYIELLYNTTIE
jgi:hypothetical protein